MAASILFVDDEPLVLESIREISHLFDSDWQIKYASSGRETLSLLKKDPVDIVVVDMHMPDYDGLRLLAYIRDHYPFITRIAMSGFASYETAMQAANTSHQFLHKPIEADRLANILKRSITLKRHLSDAKLQALVAQLGTLPSLPDLYSQLIQEINSPDASIKKVGEIISHDMAMASKILQLINSAFFGLPRRVSSTSQAVNLLGLQVIKALVLTIQIFKKFNGNQKTEHFINLLFDHSFNTARLARAIATEEKCEQRIVDDTFLAGLVHDVGKLVLQSNMPRQYRSIMEHAVSKGRPAYLKEEDELDSSHAEIGAHLLGLWGLPMGVVEAVALSHKPGQCPCNHFTPLTAVHAADAIMHQVRPIPELAGETEVHSDYLDSLGLPDRYDDWLRLAQTLELE